MSSSHVFTQSMQVIASNSNVLNTSQTKFTDSGENHISLDKKLVSNIIEFSKSGQDRQSMFEFIGALKQVYPGHLDYITMSDGRIKTVLIG